MQLKFKKASDYKNEKLSLVVFGEPGSGKTSLIKTIEEKVLIIDAEVGLQAINDLDIDTFPLWENSEGVLIPRTERFDKFEKFLKLYNTGEITLDHKWMVIDSITEIAENLVEHLMEKHRDVDKSKKALVLWGEYNERITAMIKDLRDLKGMNVVCLALINESKNDTGSKDVTLELKGKISQRLPAIFDEVFYLHAGDEGKRTIITQKHKNIVCKDRSGKLEKYEEPNLQKIANKIKGVK